ncbi:hypothetical protein PL81_06635, partial [Streptomyces sp. RSD-27]
QPRELDGDVIAAGTRLSAEVEPGALRIWIPPRTPHAPGERGATGAAGAAERAGRAAHTVGG